MRIPVRRVWSLIALAILLVCSFSAILSVNVLSAVITKSPATNSLEQSLNNEEMYYSVSLPVNADAFEQEYTCLAQAVYFEARSEPVRGQHAVAEVILNRVSDSRFPDTVCGVVFQNEKWRHRCQFSFACDGLSDRPREHHSWKLARHIAAAVLSGIGDDVTGYATHYHATYVQPNWAARLDRTVQMGQHIFYR